MAYLLDANVFIQAKNLHYGLDFCPAFWQWLVEQNWAGKVFSIEKVGDEIQVGDDDLSDWAKERDSDFFLNPDAAVLQSLAPRSHAPAWECIRCSRFGMGSHAGAWDPEKAKQATTPI